MPSKGRWTLNPRKWFGTIAHAAQKRDKKPHINDSIAQFPPKLIRTNPTVTIGPRILVSRNKTKVSPTSPINDNKYTQSTNTFGSFTQFQLPSYGTRREKTSILLASTSATILFNRTNTLLPTRIEPSIRKNNQFKEQHSIDGTQWITEPIIDDTSKYLISPSLSSQYGNSLQQNSSEQCLINCQQDSSNDFIDKSFSQTRSRSSSSIDDHDEHDESSSSGIYTDERADLTDRHRTASKDTLSTVEVLSIESIADSQISLNHDQSRSLTHRYRLPISTFETINNNKSAQSQRQTLPTRPYRARSAENILKDNQTTTPVTTKSRQSSALIAKKIEKRIPTGRSPPVTLEKAGFVRIANATYRLTTGKDDHLYRRHRENSFIPCSNYDDSLPSANDEESYATLPRTSSTEQLNQNLHNDLRAIVDDCLRPMIDSMNKPTYRSIKTQHRSKRSQKTPHPQDTQIDIEDITDKLLSSIDCSTYAQYQRCY